MISSSYQQPVVITTSAYVMPIITSFGDHPVQCTCSQCEKQIVTRTEKHSGMLAWIICIILFFFVCWPCAFIPFCVDSCKVSWNSIHLNLLEFGFLVFRIRIIIVLIAALYLACPKDYKFLHNSNVLLKYKKFSYPSFLQINSQ